MLDTVARWQIPHSYFADFLDSMRMDLTVTGYATYDDLVALHVGLGGGDRAADAADPRSRRRRASRWDRLETHAIDLGYAFQLTNFLRDVAEDLRRGRVYLPQESLDQFGVDRDRLRRGRVDEPIRNLLAWEIERARGLYRRAEPGIDLRAPDLARLPAHRTRRCTKASSTRSSATTTTCSRTACRSGSCAAAAVGVSGLRMRFARAEPHPQRQRDEHQREPEQQILDRRVRQPPADDRVRVVAHDRACRSAPRW